MCSWTKVLNFRDIITLLTWSEIFIHCTVISKCLLLASFSYALCISWCLVPNLQKKKKKKTAYQPKTRRFIHIQLTSWQLNLTIFYARERKRKALTIAVYARYFVSVILLMSWNRTVGVMITAGNYYTPFPSHSFVCIWLLRYLTCCTIYKNCFTC